MDPLCTYVPETSPDGDVMSEAFGLPPSDMASAPPPAYAVPPASAPPPAYAVPPTSAPPPYAMPPTYAVPPATAPPPAYAVPPTSAPPASSVPMAYGGSATPGSAVHPARIGGLIFVGVRNVVMCRNLSEKGPDGKSVVVWSREVGDVSPIHRAEPYVVFSGGVIVVRYITTVTGLDPMTGATRWTQKLKDNGFYDLAVMAVNGSVVYIGTRDFIVALSAFDGKYMWEFDFDHRFRVCLPTIVCCGLSIFGMYGDDCVLLNAADGKVRWRSRFSGAFNPPHTAAWDGANRLMLGCQGYLYPIDLRSGQFSEKFNMKGTGFHDVCVCFDNIANIFYGFSNGSVFALRGGDVNSLVWRADIGGGEFAAIACEPQLGRLYVANGCTLYCLNVNGQLVFKKSFDVPVFSRGLYALTLDILGSGTILIGSNGFFIVLDPEGNKIEDDELKGMRYGQTCVCSQTANVNANGSCEQYHRLSIIERSKK